MCASRVQSAQPLLPLSEILPSSAFRSRHDGVLLAVRSLSVGEEVFSEPPLSWQPSPKMRSRLCARCGREAVQPCSTCRQVAYCSRCSSSSCTMCPELSITQGHVGAFTLMALEVVRGWEEHQLPADALSQPAHDAKMVKEALGCTTAVQKVAHWCSAVRWTDERAQELITAILAGRVEHTVAGSVVSIGYYPKFARVRASANVGQANARLQVCQGPEHAFTVKAVVTAPIPEGSALCLG
mmetsp:Transcript_44600/g.99933  ORF Transcript_44600/g.99933 Transcript_44600/m.99933 type:complete len:240 (+) Transcript_44600:3-722(+)